MTKSSDALSKNDHAKVKITLIVILFAVVGIIIILCLGTKDINLMTSNIDQFLNTFIGILAVSVPLFFTATSLFSSGILTSVGRSYIQRHTYKQLFYSLALSVFSLALCVSAKFGSSVGISISLILPGTFIGVDLYVVSLALFFWQIRSITKAIDQTVPDKLTGVGVLPRMTARKRKPAKKLARS
jgi:hypothetical protein